MCGDDFLIRGNTADINRRFCSKSCATSGAHKAERERGVLRVNGNYGKMKPGLEATESPTLMQIAWAAGLFEGEGSCCRVARHSAQVHLGQKDRWVIDRMRALFGGNISERQINGRPFYEWQVSGTRARGFLMTMFSFLSPRRQEQVKASL
jgi:hypothetical protein